METIKNYLESMFMNLPLTEEVIKAKRELLTMMQDKYNELIAEGKREHEAVSIVISEFGDLKEISDDLGLKTVMEESIIEKIQVSEDEAFSYVRERSESAFRIALGVALFIGAPIGFILESTTRKFFFSGNEVWGIIFFFVCIAIGVALVVYSGVNRAKWDYLFRGTAAISMSTAEEIEKERFSFISVKNLYVTVGIAVIILGVGVTAILGEFTDSCGAAFLLFTALGVGSIIYGNVKFAAYNHLLDINGIQYKSEKKNRKEDEYTGDNKWLELLFSTYWSTITCLYLVISFITGAWHITWIMWVIAPFLKKILLLVFED